MNFLFLTQGSSLSVFFEVAENFKTMASTGKFGFYISSSSFFHTFEKDHPVISSSAYELLKEWDIISLSKNTSPNVQKLRNYEQKYGDPVLWNALIADRRIILGKKASIEQDYASRFSHDRMLAILEVGIERMESLFDKIQPDAVIGFICVTIGDYLAYLIARARNIPIINLRATRIKNYFYAGEDIMDTSPELEMQFHKILKNGVSEKLKNDVLFYLKDVRKTHAMYEGVVPVSQAISRSTINTNKTKKHGISKYIKNLGNILKSFYNYKYGKYRHDNSHRGILYPLWFYKVKRPLRLKLLNLYLRRFYISEEKLSSIEFAFFPLHSEPEVTLMVYARSYLNQIEVARNIARNLPVGMKLVIKEHPFSVGKRPLTFYKKLLDIPGVVLAPPHMESRELVNRAHLISIISGSIGLEALIMQKPVIYFGVLPFGCLSDSMIRHIDSPENLGWEIKDLLCNHKHDEEALIAYISAVIQTSTPVDFYSKMLRRRELFDSAEKNSDTIRSQHIQRLSEYILGVLKRRTADREQSIQPM